MLTDRFLDVEGEIYIPLSVFLEEVGKIKGSLLTSS